MGLERRRLARSFSLLWAIVSVSPAAAVDHLLGHKVSVSRYGGNPAVGRSFKLVVKGGKQGNPTAFSLPANPAAGGAYVVVERDGGVLVDSLTAGEWKGLGNPAGSRGWKYRNKNAPAGGPVKILLVKQRVIKLVAKGTGSMPLPDGTSGSIHGVIALDGERYCTEATPLHKTDVAGKIIKTAGEAPLACATACAFGSDSDGDRLDDCVETDTGVFAGGLDTGTDPNDADTDDDGLSDGDEVLLAENGLNLPALGVNPLRRDILVEYDWFDDGLECSQHSHRPTAAALDKVTVAFAAAPVLNPDGSTGINFIHDRGQGGAFDGGNRIPDADGVLVGGVSSPEFQTYKSAHFADERRGYFHYTILPHRYNTSSGSSGQAEVYGDDMIVSLYCANSDKNVAHTIMHEIGHNLGLRHGGRNSCNYKPNYNSVMNYRYQFPGVDDNCTPPGNGVLDYSIGDRLSLDENDLDENVGVCGSPSWDWNGNSIIESSVADDLNSADEFQEFVCDDSTMSVLEDYDDWANLVLDVLPNPLSGASRFASLLIDCENPAPMP